METHHGSSTPSFDRFVYCLVPYPIRTTFGFGITKHIKLCGCRIVEQYTGTIFVVFFLKSIPVDNDMFREKKKAACQCHDNKFQKQFSYDFSRFILMIFLCNFFFRTTQN
jgi:hypothetical protein